MSMESVIMQTATPETPSTQNDQQNSGESGISKQIVQKISKSKIGIIYPPPEIRAIVDKTAGFVARNGIDFEDRIRANEVQNAKFNFLNPNDPYFAYYKHKLKEFSESLSGNQPLSSNATSRSQTTSSISNKDSRSQQQNLSKAKRTKMFIDLNEPYELLEPPEPYQFLLDAPSIASLDLDIVKLTAQFVASNGRSFLNNLVAREQRNYLFDFLKPQHILFPYFFKLVEQYKSILIPLPDALNKLHLDCVDSHHVTKRIRHRYEYMKTQEWEKKKEENEKERERIAFAQIDWHDFIVVETVSFREDERSNLPSPISKEKLGARILEQERCGKIIIPGTALNDEVAMELAENEDDNQMNIGSESNIGAFPIQNHDTTVFNNRLLPESVPILKDYDPKNKITAQSSIIDGVKIIDHNKIPPKSSEKLMISPITGELIPADSLQQHLKSHLLDPKWKEERQKQMEVQETTQMNMMTGVNLDAYFKDLAKKRTDIFDSELPDDSGSSTSGHLPSSSALNSRNDHVQHSSDASSSLNNRSNNEPVIQASNNQSEIPNMLPPINENSSSIPSLMSVPTPAVFGNAASGSLNHHNPLSDTFDSDPHESKRLKISETSGSSGFIPENVFLSSQPYSHVSLQVLIPNNMEAREKNRWKLLGQVEIISCDLTDQVLKVKQRINEIVGVPVQKIKLLLGNNNLFMKDQLTLAYYNISSSSFIQMMLKERGGQK